jgi:exodeoxyribonuclease VII small subunit
MPKKNLSYKDAITEIEEILSKIESDTLDIDALTERVKRVSFLISFCREKLHTTEKEVEKILRDIEGE